MKKAASKKTVKKTPKVEVANVEVEEIAQESNEEAVEVTVEVTEEVAAEVQEEFVPDFEGVDSKSPSGDFSDSDRVTLDKFINVYSPPVITSANAKLAKTLRGKSVIKVTCDKATEGSMPRFIDGLSVVFE